MTIEQQYKNQVDRIRRALKQSSARGFVFDADATLANIVKKPKRITRGTIRRLKKLTAPKIREQYATEFIDFKTGQRYSKQYGEKYAKYHNRDKIDTVTVDAADAIISNFVNHVGQWVIFKRGGKGARDYTMREYAVRWLSSILGRYPKAVIARGLQNAQDAGAWLTTQEVYEIGVESAISQIAAYINLPADEMKNMQSVNDTYDGEFYDLDEYTRENVYYADLYNF